MSYLDCFNRSGNTWVGKGKFNSDAVFDSLDDRISELVRLPSNLSEDFQALWNFLSVLSHVLPRSCSTTSRSIITVTMIPRTKKPSHTIPIFRCNVLFQYFALIFLRSGWRESIGHIDHLFKYRRRRRGDGVSLCQSKW